MNTIPVDTYRTGSAFPSFEAAIRHAMRNPLLGKAKADEQLVLGSQIIDGFWTDTTFVVRFSNDRFLRVWVDPIGTTPTVNWCVVATEPHLRDTEVQRVGSAAVVLEFPKLGTHFMDRSAILAARRGRDVKMFFVNSGCFFLYTERQRIMCFQHLYRRDTGNNLLYVYEDD